MVVMRGVAKNLMTKFFGSGNMRRKRFPDPKNEICTSGTKCSDACGGIAYRMVFVMRGR
jgi:hypothetical protein